MCALLCVLPYCLVDALPGIVHCLTNSDMQGTQTEEISTRECWTQLPPSDLRGYGRPTESQSEKSSSERNADAFHAAASFGWCCVCLHVCLHVCLCEFLANSTCCCH